MRRTVLASVVWIVMAGPSWAAFYDGNDLYKECSEAKILAFGYVTGLIDSAEALHFRHESRNMDKRSALKPFCIPPEATVGQVTDVMCKFLGNHPEQRHRPASLLVPEAFERAFPCRG